MKALKTTTATTVALALIPATAWGPIYGPDEPAWWSGENRAYPIFFEPSAWYYPIILPVLSLVLAVLFVRSRGRPGWDISAHIIAIITSVVTGLFIFLYLPWFYRDSVPVLVEFETPFGPPVFTRPSLAAMAQARWGLLLMMIWFALQPQNLEWIRPSPVKQGQLPIAFPAFLVAGLLTMMVIYGLFSLGS